MGLPEANMEEGGGEGWEDRQMLRYERDLRLSCLQLALTTLQPSSAAAAIDDADKLAEFVLQGDRP